jgi:hypothetical protein
MRDEDLFSHAGPPPSTSDHERGGNSDRSARSPAYPVSQEAPASAHPPKIKRPITPRYHVRLLLVVMVVVALAGGYRVFRAGTSRSIVLFPSVQVSSKDRMSNVANSRSPKIVASPGVLPSSWRWESSRHLLLARLLIRCSFWVVVLVMHNSSIRGR